MNEEYLLALSICYQLYFLIYGVYSGIQYVTVYKKTDKNIQEVKKEAKEMFFLFLGIFVFFLIVQTIPIALATQQNYSTFSSLGRAVTYSYALYTLMTIISLLIHFFVIKDIIAFYINKINEKSQNEIYPMFSLYNSHIGRMSIIIFHIFFHFLFVLFLILCFQ